MNCFGRWTAKLCREWRGGALNILAPFAFASCSKGQNSCTWKINSGSYARYLIRGSIYWFIWIKNSNSSQMRGNSLLKSIQLEITKKPPLALLFYRNLDERHCLFVNLAFFLVSQQSTRSFTTHQPDLFANWGQMRNSPSYHVHVKLIITQDCSEHYKLFCNNNNNYFYSTHILSSWSFTVYKRKQENNLHWAWNMKLY